MIQDEINKLKEEIRLIPLYDTVELLDISDSEYFSSKYADYISNSRLSLINPDQKGNSEKYINGFGSDSFSDSFYFGSAVHNSFLQKDDYCLVENIDRPTAKMGFVIDEIISNRQKGYSIYDSIKRAVVRVDYYKGVLTPERLKNILKAGYKYYIQRTKYIVKPNVTPIYLGDKDKVRLKGCLSSLNNNRKIQNLLNPAYIVNEPLNLNEASLFMNVKAIYKGKQYILKLKAKLDNFIFDFEDSTLILNDLKTTGHYLQKFPESFVEYHYYRQMGMYLWLLSAYIKKIYPKSFTQRANMIVVSTIPDFQSNVFPVSNKQIQLGLEEFGYLLRLVVKLQADEYDISEKLTDL